MDSNKQKTSFAIPSLFQYPFQCNARGHFDDNYTIEKWDFQRYLQNANSTVAQANAAAVASLPDSFAVSDLKSLAHQPMIYTSAAFVWNTSL